LITLSLSQSPLILGCDLRIATRQTMKIIAHKEVIAINQGTSKATDLFPKPKFGGLFQQF